MRQNFFQLNACQLLKSKKASFTSMATAIFFVAVIIVIIFFIAKSRLYAYTIIEDTECKNSIQNHVTTQQLTGGDVSSKINCATKYYNIKANNEDQAKKALAESLKSCWGTWGKGELQLFSKDNLYCHICSVTDFDGSKIQTAKNFPQYLATEIIDSGSGKGMTYAQYLRYFSTEDADEDVLEKLNSLGSSLDIDTSKDYAAVFVYARGENTIKDFITKLSGTGSGTITSGLMGGVIGGAAGYATSYFIGIASIFGGPVTWVVGGVTLGSVTGIYAYMTSDTDHLAMTLLREYNAEELKNIGCLEAPVAQDEQKEKLG